jgi:phosphate transport system substrate-binding protein
MQHNVSYQRLVSVLLQFCLGFALVNLIACNSSPDLSASNRTTAAAEQQITMVGSSSSAGALHLLASAYEAKDKNVKTTFLPDSQSGSNITAVKNKLVDVGGSSHIPKPEEESDQIQSREIARDLLVVATHNSVTGVSNLSTEELKAVYSGKVTNWKELGGADADIVVLDRPEDESAKKLLREYYLGADLKTTSKAVVLKQETELIQTLQDTPNSIGTFSLANAISNQLPVNRLSLDAIAPTPENFANGKYKMVRPIVAVWGKQPSPATQGFLDFVFRSEGQKVLKDAGFVAAKAP